MAEQTLIGAGAGGVSQSPTTKEITTDKNISFANDNTVYQKTTFETTIDGSTSTKQVAISVPADVVLKTIDGSSKTDFKGVFLAPTVVT
jgi:hypothetical protein